VGASTVLALEAAGLLTRTPIIPSTSGLEGPLQTLSELIHGAGDAVMWGGMGVFVLVVLRALVPIAWLANAAWLALLLGLGFLSGQPEPDWLVLAAVYMASFLLLLTRVGFLSGIVYVFGLASSLLFPLTLQPGDWLFSSSLMVLAGFAFLGAWSYRAAVAGRSLLDAGTA
jgi:hypothetical protein